MSGADPLESLLGWVSGELDVALPSVYTQAFREAPGFDPAALPALLRGVASGS
jgi:hypothetical protein